MMNNHQILIHKDQEKKFHLSHLKNEKGASLEISKIFCFKGDTSLQIHDNNPSGKYLVLGFQVENEGVFQHQEYLAKATKKGQWKANLKKEHFLLIVNAIKKQFGNHV